MEMATAREEINVNTNIQVGSGLIQISFQNHSRKHNLSMDISSPKLTAEVAVVVEDAATTADEATVADADKLTAVAEEVAIAVEVEVVATDNLAFAMSFIALDTAADITASSDT